MKHLTTYCTFLIIVFLILSGHLALAQKSTARKIAREANDYFEKLDYVKAYDLYKEAIAQDTTSIENYYKAGISLFKLNKTDSLTLFYFQKSSIKIPESHYYIGRIYHRNSNLIDAMNEFLLYEKKIEVDSDISPAEAERWLEICENSIEQSLKAQEISINNIGDSINTAYPEYAPVLSPDEQMLVFTSRREGSTGNEKDVYNNFYEDIYYSIKKDALWSKALPLSDNINTNTHDASVTFALDSSLIIYRTDEKKTGGDLYTSKQNGNNWETPRLLSNKINSAYCEPSASYSPGGEIIIFSSNKPEGLGGKDLYRITKFSDSLYSKPLNLGPLINTPYDEDAPFMYYDEKTLYFSSKGHNTIGGYDVFKSEMDSNGGFQQPINMGLMLNSTSDDIYFIMTKNGEKAFFSTDRLGNLDIYEATIIDNNYIVIKGNIVVEEDKEIDFNKIEITVIEKQTSKRNGIYKLKKNYSSFILVVDISKEYKIMVDGPEIEPLTKDIKFDTDKISLEVKKVVE